MAALIKALNAKIRSNPVSDYLCSTRECCPDSLSCPPLADVGHSVLRLFDWEDVGENGNRHELT
jgi:hypothetical protein